MSDRLPEGTPPRTASARQTLDELKMLRDGWTQPGPKPSVPVGIRSVFEFRRYLPNGNVLTSDGGAGEIEWYPGETSIAAFHRRPSPTSNEPK